MKQKAFDLRKYITETRIYTGIHDINEDARFQNDGKGPSFESLAKKAKSPEEFIKLYKSTEVGNNRANSKASFNSESQFLNAAKRFWETVNGKYPNFNTGYGSRGPESANAEKLAKKYDNFDDYMKYMYDTFPTLEKTSAMKNRLTKLHSYFHK